MIGRPDTVRIGAFDFAIIWADNTWFRSTNASAQFDGVKEQITIYDDGSLRLIACRFLHEVYHGLVWFQEQSKDGNMIEDDAANIGSYGIVDFWRSNPQVFDWWIGLVRAEKEKK